MENNTNFDIQKTSPLFHKNFVMLCLGQLFSLFGNFILKFAVSMCILEVTGSATIFAGILSISIIPTILLTPFGGVFADRFNRKKMMVVLDVLSGVVVLGATIILMMETTIVMIGVLLVVLAVLGAFESPTVQACVPQMQSTQENIAKANAVINQVAAVAALAAPFLGNLLYVALGLTNVLYITTAMFFVTAFFECFIRLTDTSIKFGYNFVAEIKSDFKISLKFIFKEKPAIAKVLVLAAVVNFFIAGIATVGLPYIVRNVLSLGSTHYAIAESVLAVSAIVGSVIGGMLASKLTNNKLHVFLVIAGLSILPVGIIFMVSTSAIVKYVVIIAAFCFTQISACIFSIFGLSTIQSQTPNEILGKVMAYTMALSICAQPLGQIIFGVLFDGFATNLQFVFIPTALLICIVGLASKKAFRAL